MRSEPSYPPPSTALLLKRDRISQACPLDCFRPRNAQPRVCPFSAQGAGAFRLSLPRTHHHGNCRQPQRHQPQSPRRRLCACLPNGALPRITFLLGRGRSPGEPSICTLEIHSSPSETGRLIDKDNWLSVWVTSRCCGSCIRTWQGSDLWRDL
jgi:hypothetical protein